MKCIALEETDLSARELIRMAEEDTVIVTKRGKPLASVKSLSGADWESVSLANNPEFLALIEESRRSFRENGGVSLEEVRHELGLTEKAGTRKGRRKKA